MKKMAIIGVSIYLKFFPQKYLSGPEVFKNEKSLAIAIPAFAHPTEKLPLKQVLIEILKIWKSD